MDGTEVTSGASFRTLGPSGMSESDAGLRAVATTRWVGFLVAIYWARPCPMPDEQPVTFNIIY